MKAVFVFPPIWTKKSPSTGITSISGYLKTFGIETKIFDFNIDYYSEKLTDENYNLVFDFVQELLLKQNPNENESDIIRIYKENEEIYNSLKGQINKSVELVRSTEYYNSDKYKMASLIIAKAIEFISLPYFPFIIFDEKIENLKNEFKYEDYKSEALNINNIFYSYMSKRALEIIDEKPDCVGISINFEGQMLAGLTLAHILKKKHNIKVMLGGTNITRSIENIRIDNSFFEKFADYVMIGDGEIPTLKLLRYFQGICSIEEVPSIIYKENGIIKFNELLKEKISIDFSQDFDYTTEKQYFLPEKVFPINISKGCYWGKCKFCDFGLQYSHKNLEKVIQEIKTLKEKYNAKYFYLTDSALSPKTAKAFADLLIDEKLDIRWTTFLRFEEVYDKKFLLHLYKSGLRCVSWGLESASQKVLDLMNKGTKVSVIQRILKDSADLGIANRLTVIYLFPGETYRDFCETIDFLKQNKKNIFFIIFHRYLLKRYSYVFEHMDEFGINLTTQDIKSEYQANELGISYKQEDYDIKLNELSSISSGTYKNPDETLLYFSYKEKEFS